MLYVLDGDWYFGSAVEAVRSNAPEVVVVGIGYPEDEPYIESVLERHRPLPPRTKDESPFRLAAGFERMYDLTLPASDEVLARSFTQDARIRAADVGGLDAFLKVLETEIKPCIAAVAPLDGSNQVIFGHSLGGLAVLHALFVEPDAFRTFLAASPSVWWDGKALLKGERKFAEAVRTGIVTARVLITMGSEEQTADPRIVGKWGLNFAEYEVLVREHRMVENARELTERLKALSAAGTFEVEEFAIFPKQHHAISVWPALGRAVSFAFS